MYKRLFITIFLLANSLYSATLDDYMSAQEQRTTGVINLTPDQKEALAGWLATQFEPTPPPPAKKTMYLSENLSKGQILVMSDGSRYKINPNDISTSALWLFPISVEIGQSTDPNYPLTITNTSSKSVVRAQIITPDQ